MARRGDELDAETAEIEDQGAEDIDIGFTGIAAAGRDLAQLQGATEEAQHPGIEGARQLCFTGPLPQILALSGSKTMIGAETQSAMRAGGRALGAEEATAEIDLKSTVTKG